MHIQCSISLLLNLTSPSNLPQGCLTEMTNYTSSEVPYFLLHFIYPYGLHPFPSTSIIQTLLYPTPCSVRPWGHPPSHALSSHTTKWHQVSLSERISSHLPYVTIRYAGLALWGGRAVRCDLAQSRGRRDKIERSSDLPATWEVHEPRPRSAGSRHVLAMTWHHRMWKGLGLIVTRHKQTVSST